MLCMWWHHNAIVVPKAYGLCEDVLMKCHDAFYSEHNGYYKDMEQLKIRLWWPSLVDNVKFFF